MKKYFRTMEVLHEMAVCSLKELEYKFGTEWAKTQDILKEVLWSNFEWKENVTVVNIIKRNGRVERSRHMVTKAALFEIVRDGFYVIPSTFSYTFKVWNADTMETVETTIITETWNKSDVLDLFEDWEEKNEIDIRYFNKWSITRH